MSWEAWFTLAVVLVTLALLATERFSAPITMIGAVTVLLVSGVIDTKAALAGFSNEAPVTIAALYVVTGAARATGALDLIAHAVLGRDGPAPTQRRARRKELVRLLVPSTMLSAFVYNTPTVALLAPEAAGWARRTQRSPSWYLMALNDAVVLGGLLTAIGTTTNVVVSGLMTSAGMKAMRMFEITPIGLPIAVVGVGLIVLLGSRLVPTRRSPGEQVSDDIRDFVVEMRVPVGSPLAGRTVAEAGLRSLQGVYLVQIDDGDQVIAPVSPDNVLSPGARLTFAGNVNHVLDLQRMPGLVSAEQPHIGLARGSGHRFYEVVVAPTARLVGSTLAEIGFRARFDGGVLAIHRAGSRVPGKLGQVRLRAGDVLLIVADPGWGDRARSRGEFSTVSSLQGASLPRRDKAWVVGVTMLGFVVVAATGLLGVLTAALVAAIVVVASGVLTPAQARDSVDVNVIVVLAASFGLGNAMADTGLAAEIAHQLVRLCQSAGDVGVLIGVLVSTVLITQLVTNNAVAVIMFPIALAAAHNIHADPRTFAIVVAIGASTCFMTPIAYQTNLIVQGMAGYRFADFLPLGTVLVVVTTVLTAVLAPIVIPLH
ncbi:MAG: SLC13 family permease [Frankiaceae bacterium]